jgi:patatin-like phospholipase/acyl hydrolase
MPTRILSIDGGGIRGVIPATVLTYVEKKTGKAIGDLFDYLAGTSTGGILALGLAARAPDGTPRFTAAQLLELYRNKGATIFSRSVWHAIVAVNNLDGPKYEAGGIESVLRDCFGTLALGDAPARTKVLVPAYDIVSRTPFFFRSYLKAGEPDTRAVPMWKVARGTSAAPTFFPPEDVPVGDTDRAFVDGGVFANNPAMCAVVEALRVDGARLDDIMMLSLGTGNLDRPIPYDTAKGWGLTSWAHPLIDILMDGVTDTVDYEVGQLLGKNYLRLQTDLPQEEQELDDARATNIDGLQANAEAMVTAKQGALDALCQRLI